MPGVRVLPAQVWEPTCAGRGSTPYTRRVLNVGIRRYRGRDLSHAKRMCCTMKKRWGVDLLVVVIGMLLIVVWLRNGDKAQFARALGFHATDWPAFWLSFWAAACSGLLYSLIIGFALWWTQRSSDERRQRRQYAEDIAVFQTHLRNALALPAVYKIIDNVSDTASRRSLAVAAELEDRPIPQWRRELPRQRDFFDKIAQLQRTYYAFSTASQILDIWLQESLHAYHNSWFAQLGPGMRPAGSNNEQILRRYVIARVIGETPDEAQRLSETRDQLEPERHYNAVAQDPKVAPLLASFTEAREHFHEATNLLKGFLET